MSGLLAAAAPGYTLRIYQQHAVNRGVAFLTTPAFRGRNGLIVIPTGAGKSLVIAGIATQLNEPVLVFQPSKEILEQNAEKLRGYGFYPGIWSASLGKKRLGLITLATIGSVIRDAAAFRQFKYVLIDEAHLVNAKGGMYRQFLDVLSHARVLGLTATPYRLSSDSMGAQLRFLTRTRPRIFDDVVYYLNLAPLFQAGFLAPLTYHERDVLDPTRLRLNSTGADFDDAALQRHMRDSGFVGQLQDTVHHLLQAGHKQVLVFTRFTEESEALARAVPGAAMITANTPADRRAQILRSFKSGLTRVVSNVGVLTTGFDHPELTTVVLARPTMSLALYYQCLDEDTEVLTRRGWLRRGEVVESDEVAAMDPGTGKVSWQRVLRVVDRPRRSDERMVSVSAPHLDIRVTDDHELVLRARGAGSWRKQTAIAASRRRGMFQVPVSATLHTNGASLTDDELRVIGWFLSDGNVNKITRALTISQSEGKPTHCQAIRSALRGAGLKFGETRNRRTGRWARYDDNLMFTVSHGKPRGRDKHLRGWAHLSQWLDRTIPACFEELSREQVRVLLSALYLGDGANNRKTVTWIPRTWTIACGLHERMADRLQALCVMRGFRCNKARQLSPAGKALWNLHIRDVSVSSLAGTRVADGEIGGQRYQRSRLAETVAVEGERVWCVTNAIGTLFIRRNGKVAIVGNCVGRVIRPHPSKPTAHVVDLVGLKKRFGPIEQLWMQPGGKTGQQWVIVTGEQRDRVLTNVPFGLPRGFASQKRAASAAPGGQ